MIKNNRDKKKITLITWRQLKLRVNKKKNMIYSLNVNWLK